MVPPPAADVGATAIIHGQLEVLLVDEALVVVLAGLPLAAGGRLHLDVLALAPEAGFLDPLAKARRRPEGGEQIGMTGDSCQRMGRMDLFERIIRHGGSIPYRRRGGGPGGASGGREAGGGGASVGKAAR